MNWIGEVPSKVHCLHRRMDDIRRMPLAHDEVGRCGKWLPEDRILSCVDEVMNRTAEAICVLANSIVSLPEGEPARLELAREIRAETRRRSVTHIESNLNAIGLPSGA